jgi:hypothetical protein
MESSCGYLEECLNGNWSELSQEGNYNANSRLFLRNGTVRKIYTEKAESNAAVILALSQRHDLETVPELILPSRILWENGKVIGFEMPWADGRTWTEVRTDPGISVGDKLRLLEKAADALRRFPEDLVWGDVHGNNLLVCGESVRIADPDGLGLSCPQENLLDELPERYCGTDGHIRISRDTDILGLCALGLELMLDGLDFFSFPPEWKRQYLCFLRKHGADALADSIQSTITEKGPCLLRKDAFLPGDTGLLTYERFLKETGLWLEELKYKEKIDLWIGEREKRNE